MTGIFRWWLMAEGYSLFTADSLPKTKLTGLLLPAGLTMIPGLLLLFNNADRIVNPRPILEVTMGAGVLAALLARFLWRDFAPHVDAAIMGAFGYGFFSLSWLDGTSVAVRMGAWLLTAIVGSVVLVWLLSDSRLVVNIATFTFSHILSPHQPYQYNADCSLRDGNARGQGLGDGHRAEFRPLYVGQATCLAQQLEQAMTTLIEADPTAVIVLQADHGSEFEIDDLDNPSWEPNYLRERFGIFRMTRLPETCSSTHLAAQSIINTAELLTSCLSGTEPDLIEPQIFLGGRQDKFEAVREAEEALIFAD